MEKTSTIGKDFTTKELIKFAAPPILAQFAMALLSTLDDGLFLSRYVGTTALAAFSIAFPVFMFFMALVELFNGASILCSTKMGEGKSEEARKIFTATVITAVFTSLNRSRNSFFMMVSHPYHASPSSKLTRVGSSGSSFRTMLI